MKVGHSFSGATKIKAKVGLGFVGSGDSLRGRKGERGKN